MVDPELFFCFFPFSIPGIVFGSRVDRYLRAGYVDEAIVASGKAKAWTLASVIAGIVMWIYYFAKNGLG